MSEIPFVLSIWQPIWWIEMIIWYELLPHFIFTLEQQIGNSIWSILCLEIIVIHNLEKAWRLNGLRSIQVKGGLFNYFLLSSLMKSSLSTLLITNSSTDSTIYYNFCTPSNIKTSSIFRFVSCETNPIYRTISSLQSHVYSHPFIDTSSDHITIRNVTFRFEWHAAVWIINCHPTNTGDTEQKAQKQIALVIWSDH